MSFSNQQSHGAPSLPSINSLINGRLSCPKHFYGCPGQFYTPLELEQDQRMCRPPGHVVQVDSFASDIPGQVCLPHRINTHIPSSSSSVASEPLADSNSPVMFTTNVNRASSVSRQIPDRRSPQVTHRISKKSARRASTPLSGEVDRKVKKTEKEKLNRSNQAAVLYRMEDYLRYYIGWERQEQSGGNGNAAGLNTNKFNLLRGAEAVIYYLLHKSRCQEIRNGTVGEFEAEMQQVANAAMEDSHDPYHGSFMESSEELCTHKDTKSKQCATHGTADWRECRKDKTSRAFYSNQAAYYYELGLPISASLAENGRYTGTLPHHFRSVASSRGHSRQG